MESLIKPTISIIIPVYNADKYLDKCIASILNQTYKDYELILVNDGSTDNSLELCNKYAESIDKIKVVNQLNGGAIFARRTGFLNSTGEWICFVDADDTMPEYALELLIGHSSTTELVIGAVDKPSHIRETVSLREVREWAIGSKIPATFYAKLFKRHVLTDFVFDIPRSIYFGEDMIFFIRVVFNLSNPPQIINDVVYNYNRNVNSISHGHRSSMDYEELFDQYRLMSIPQTELADYMICIIKNKLNGLVGIAYNYPNELSKSEHKYIRLLKDQIAAYHYKCSIKENILLYSKNPLIIKTVAFFSLAMTSLKYRLKI